MFKNVIGDKLNKLKKYNLLNAAFAQMSAKTVEKYDWCPASAFFVGKAYKTTWIHN